MTTPATVARAYSNARLALADIEDAPGEDPPLQFSARQHGPDERERGQREARRDVRVEDTPWLEQPALCGLAERDDDAVRDAVARVEDPGPAERNRDLRGHVRHEVDEAEEAAQAQPLMEEQ